jgi:hypothetical protein
MSTERTEVTPVDMTWRRIGTQRPFAVIDEAHLHFVSSWETGCVGGFFEPNDGRSRVPNPLLVVEDGMAKIDGAGIIPSNVHPMSPWVSCEAIIDDVDEEGSIGPALIKDALNYTSAQYDHGAGEIRLTEMNNGVTRTAVATYVATLPLRLTVKIMGRTVSAWVENKLVAVLIPPAAAHPDYCNPEVWKGYCYGLVSVGGPHLVSRLWGGAAGVMGAENILLVTHADGAPYLLGNKVLMTADSHGVGGLEDWNTCIWEVDLDTGFVKVIGRLYFTENFNGIVRHAGGNFVRLQWHEGRAQWLLTVLGFDGWSAHGTTPPRGFDSYAWVQIDLHGENHIRHDQLTPLGFDGVGFGFGANTWKSCDTWNVLCSVSEEAGNANNPLAYAAIRPSYYRGASLDQLSLQWRDNEIGLQMEGGTRCRLNGLDYFHWSSGDAVWPFPVYNSAGDRLGNLRDIGRYGDTSGINSGESWAEWICRPIADGGTAFYAIGNTKEIFDAFGVVNESGVYDITLLDQDRGALALWRADQVSPGREFPEWVNGRKIQSASVFVDPTPSIATGLRAHWPLLVDISDATPFARNLIPLGGGPFFDSPQGVNTNTRGLIATARIFDIAGNWTATLVATAYPPASNGALLRLAQNVELRIHDGLVRVETFDGTAWESVSYPVVNDFAAHRYTVRYLSGVLSLWHDGTNMAEGERAIEPTEGTLAIGCRLTALAAWNLPLPTFEYSFQGWIRDVRIWQRALTDGDIANL